MEHKKSTHTEQFNFNTLISALVESRSDGSVINALVDNQRKVGGIPILLYYLLNLFILTTLITVYFIRRELKEHRANCLKNTDNQDWNMVRNTHHIRTINSIQGNNINYSATKVRKRKIETVGKKLCQIEHQSGSC